MTSTVDTTRKPHQTYFHLFLHLAASRLDHQLYRSTKPFRPEPAAAAIRSLADREGMLTPAQVAISEVSMASMLESVQSSLLPGSSLRAGDTVERCSDSNANWKPFWRLDRRGCGESANLKSLDRVQKFGRHGFNRQLRSLPKG